MQTIPSFHPAHLALRLTLILLITHVTAQAAPQDHPRILFPKAAEATVKSRIQSDPLATKIYQNLLRHADHTLTQPVCHYDIPDGKRLLAQSRYALGNILHCAMAWRLTGEQKYLTRSIHELDAACAMKDWNTSHFLDTAEMTTAVAIGYDWLYHALSEQQRTTYATALRSKGLEPARAAFTSTPAWWARPQNNWAQVCATGLLMAERALERDGDPIHPARLAASRLIDACRAFYSPDGAYPEGPGYWVYGSNYHTLGLALLNDDKPQLKVPTPVEFRGSPLFTEHLTGPTGVVFNFADAGASTNRITAAQSWMAREFNDPATVGFIRARLNTDLSRNRKRSARLFPLHLLWLPAAPPQQSADLPLDSSWKGVQPLATFRSSWTRPDALYFAIKGGLPSASHGQMDVGSFILENDGVRWIEDLGSDNYNMPGYFGSQRWNYFRLTNLSHNTLVINGKLQSPDAKTSPLIEFQSTPLHGYASFNLSSAYQNQADQVIRSCQFDRKNQRITLIDHIDQPTGPVRWAIVTRAEIKIDGATAILRKSGKVLPITRHDTHGGQWEILDATPANTIENPNKGVRILAFTAPATDRLELNVSFGQPR
ncbi:MAG: heparinase II/III family protein [Verrucomicrobiae bacterium]|nr:heparinase II/III family protein [Verrucomicrobiae bacterium]NNJ43430.1 hypothetical protein [Akkermansiaceae bacterium]